MVNRFSVASLHLTTVKRVQVTAWDGCFYIYIILCICLNVVTSQIYSMVVSVNSNLAYECTTISLFLWKPFKRHKINHWQTSYQQMFVHSSWSREHVVSLALYVYR